jgi:hypothetical protein
MASIGKQCMLLLQAAGYFDLLVDMLPPLPHHRFRFIHHA